jgi:hypothetical protein
VVRRLVKARRQDALKSVVRRRWWHKTRILLVWQGGRDSTATARGPDGSDDDLAGGRLQRRRLGEDGPSNGGGDSGSGRIR